MDWLNQHLTKLWPYVDEVFCYYGVSLFFVVIAFDYLVTRNKGLLSVGCEKVN